MGAIVRCVVCGLADVSIVSITSTGGLSSTRGLCAGHELEWRAQADTLLTEMRAAHMALARAKGRTPAVWVPPRGRRG
jgi:hypothetical protein